jgi:hypothetical protein
MIVSLLPFKIYYLGVVAFAHDPSTQEAEARESGVPANLGYMGILCLKNNNNKNLIYYFLF